MNKNLLFSKYKMCWKTIMIGAIYTNREMNMEGNIFFFSNYKVFSKSSTVEHVFTETKMNPEWNLNF